jgi:2'-5' RNA ligase
MRCFIGFELDEDCRERLRIHIEPFANKLQKELGWPIRMVPPQNWHQTCLFFPDLSDGERATVWQEVLRNVEAGVWSDLLFPWEGLTLWPSPRKPSLVCLAAAPVQDQEGWPLFQRLSEEPFSKGDVEHLKVYRPHITLIRFRGGASRPYWREWQAQGSRIPQIPPTAIRYNRISMILSDVSPQKPIYPREYTAKLKSKLSTQTMLRRPQSLMLEE